MNAEQLNLTWIDFAKQIGGVHRKFAQEKAQLVCAALEKMKEETGVAPTVDFYTSKCVDPDTVQTHFYWGSSNQWR